jgi:hypothetical protein
LLIVKCVWRSCQERRCERIVEQPVCALALTGTDHRHPESGRADTFRKITVRHRPRIPARQRQGRTPGRVSLADPLTTWLARSSCAGFDGDATAAALHDDGRDDGLVSSNPERSGAPYGRTQVGAVGLTGAQGVMQRVATG